MTTNDLVAGAAQETRPNRPMIVTLSTAAMLAGLAPAALVIDKAWLIPYLALGALLVAAATARRMRSPSAARASWAEFLIATLDAGLLPAVLGLLWLFVHGAVYFALWAINALFDVSIHATFTASAVSITIMSVIAALLAWYTTDELGSALYPSDGSKYTVFHQFATAEHALRNTLLVAAGCAAAAVLAALIVRPLGSEVWLIVLGPVLWAGAMYEPPRESSVVFERPSLEVVEHIGLALAADGDYKYVANPRTGDPEVDPLLADADLLISGRHREYIVEIKQAKKDGTLLPWTAGTTVLNAARALANTRSPDSTGLPVWPLLIILDGAADETLTKFCGDQEVSLVSLDRTHGRSVVISKDRDVLEGFAQRFLNTKQPRPRVRARRPALPDRETGGTR